MKPQRLIQSTAGYELHTSITWHQPDLVQLKLVTVTDFRGSAETRSVSYFMTPSELAALTDHIDDCLAR